MKESKSSTGGGKLKPSLLWTQPPTFCSVSWRSPAANLACGSSPWGAPRSASSTCSCRLPSRCTVLAATVAPASASRLTERFSPGAPCCLYQSLRIVSRCSCDLPCSKPTHQPPPDPRGPLHISAHICAWAKTSLLLYNSHSVYMLPLSLTMIRSEQSSYFKNRSTVLRAYSTWQLNLYCYEGERGRCRRGNINFLHD